MKRSELKKILKPLIKECIKEAIFEEGVLSGIITEVMRSTQPQQTITSTQSSVNLEEEKRALLALEEEKAERAQLLEQRHRREKEKRRKLLDATGFDNVDVFSGTEALSDSGQINESAGGYSGPLSGVATGDAGVDISGIMSLGGSKNWKKLAGS